jgi:hypothetical protein
VPRLPTGDTARSVARPVRGVVRADSTGTAQAANRLSQAAFSAGVAAQEKENAFKYAKAKTGYLAEQQELIDSLQDDDWETYEERYQKGADDLRAKYAEEIGPGDLKKFDLEMTANKLNGLRSVRKNAQGMERDFALADVGEGVATNRTAALAATTPEERAEYLRASQELIEGARDRGYLTQEQAGEYGRRVAVDYAHGALDALPPQQRIDALDDYQNILDRDVRAKIRRQAENQIRVEGEQFKAQRRKAIERREKDVSAMYLQGLDVDDAPTRDEYIAAYGADEGIRRHRVLRQQRKLGQDLEAMALQSPEQIIETLNRWEPAQGEGFASAVQQQGVLISAFKAMEKEKQGDPVAYIAKHGGDTSDPDALIAEQERLGVLTPRLLSNHQADEIVRAFSNTEDGGQNAADLIEGLSTQYGEHWPDVFRQLSSRDLPPSALVIGSGVAPAVADTLARIAPIKTSDLKAGLEVPADAKRAVGEAMAPFRQTLTQQAGGDQVYATVFGEAERLAYHYMGQGKDAEDAAEQAYQDVVGSKYEFADTYRVPIQYDIDDVEDALDRVEPVIDMGLEGVSEEFIQGRVDRLIEQAYWVTNADETGLVLYHNGARVPGETEFTFEEILGHTPAPPSLSMFDNPGLL